MGVLPAQSSGARGGSVLREPDDAGVGHAAFVHLALPALEGCVAGHGPAPRVVVVTERPADLVDAPVHLVHADAFEIGKASFVDGPLLAALRARTVVGHQDHDRVVAGADLVDEVQDAADLLVGVRQERGEALHEALGQRALPLVEVVPGGHPRRPGRERGPLGDDTGRELAGEDLVAPAVPTLGEVSFVALDPLGRCVMR